MKMNKIIKKIISLIMVLLLSFFCAGCDLSDKIPFFKKDVQLIISKDAQLFFTKTQDCDISKADNPDIYRKDRLPRNTQKPVFFRIICDVENVTDEEQVLGCEIFFDGAEELQASKVSGIPFNPPSDPGRDPKTNNPYLWIHEIETPISAKTSRTIDYQFELKISDAIQKPINMEVRVEFNHKAQVNADYKIHSERITYVIDKKIEQPSNIYLKGTKICWDNVEGNAGYVVRIDYDDSKKAVLDKDVTSYDISEIYGKHTVEIKTLGDGKNNQDSVYTSKDIDIKKLETPKKIRVDKEKNILIWDSVESASGYKVSINNKEGINTLEPMCSLNQLKEGDNVIKVQACSNQGGVFNSDWIVITVHKLKRVTLSEGRTKIFWNQSEKAAKYKVFLNDEEYTVTDECFIPKISQGAAYRISVVAFSDDDFVIQSEKSESILVEPIA